MSKIYVGVGGNVLVSHTPTSKIYTVCWCRSRMTIEATAPEVHVCRGFVSGNFVVQGSRHDRLEHINRIGKFAGLVGITRSDTARDRWSLDIHGDVIVTYMEM